MPQLRIAQSDLDRYLQAIRDDYASWSGDLGLDPIKDEMVREFNDGLTFEIGNSYIKVIKRGKWQSSVHSFIVNKAGKFPIGTILKAATWKAPATNFARGMITDEVYDRVRWTGAM